MYCVSMSLLDGLKQVFNNDIDNLHGDEDFLTVESLVLWNSTTAACFKKQKDRESWNL